MPGRTVLLFCQMVSPPRWAQDGCLCPSGGGGIRTHKTMGMLESNFSLHPMRESVWVRPRAEYLGHNLGCWGRSIFWHTYVLPTTAANCNRGASSLHGQSNYFCEQNCAGKPVRAVLAGRGAPAQNLQSGALPLSWTCRCGWPQG